MKVDDRSAPSLAGLEAVLSGAAALVDDLLRDPQLPRLLAAFFSLPAEDREPILKVLERDATWRRIAEETAATTGIGVRPNPHASLYVHVLDPAPSARDVDVIRLGIDRFAQLLPLFFQEGVHAQWTRSARELIRAGDAELRGLAVRLAREVLGLLTEVEGDAPAAPGGTA